MSSKIELCHRGSESCDNLSNFHDQCVDQSCVVVSILPKTIGYRVLNGDNRHAHGALIFHVRLRNIESGYYSFYAVFEFATIHNLMHSWLVRMPQPGNFDINFGEGGHDCKQELVFIPVVDVTNDSQWMNWEPVVGTTVGLHRFDSSEEFRREWLKVSPLVGIRRSTPDGKREAVSLRRQPGREFILEDRPECVVESTPQIVNNVSDHKRPSDLVGRMMLPDINGCAGFLRVDVSENAIGFFVMPSSDFGVESTEQFDSAIYLPIGA